MILEIDLSIKNGPISQQELTALEMIATGYREGNLIISGDRPALDLLKNLNNLSPRSRAAYQNALGKLPETLGLAQQLNRRFRIFKGLKTAPTITQRKINNIDNFEHHFDLIHFEKSPSIQQLQLLAESNVDCNVYRKLFNCMLKSLGFRGIKLAFEDRGVGGSNLPPELGKVKKRSDRFFLAIVDSDLNWSSEAHKGTSKKALEEYNPPTPWGNCIVLPVREIENLAPVDIAKSNHKAAPDITQILDLSLSTKCNCWKYIDWKDGLRLRYINAIPDHTAEKTRFLGYINSGPKKTLLHCSKTTSCSQKCQCVIFNGFGDKIIHKFEDFLLEKTRSNDIRQHYTEDQWSILKSLTIEFTAWSCAKSAIYT